MKRVLVDASGFYAVLVQEDESHEHAAEVFEQASAKRWELVTTNAVVFETYALLLNRSRPGRQNALTFLEMIEGDGYTVERVTKGDESHAIELVRARQDKMYSLCDALSFVVMERLGITDALAFDRHFAGHGGFTLL